MTKSQHEEWRFKKQISSSSSWIHQRGQARSSSSLIVDMGCTWVDLSMSFRRCYNSYQNFLGTWQFLFEYKSIQDLKWFMEERLETRSRTITPWSIQSISQFPINRYNNPFYTFDLWLRPWWKHLTSQVPGHISVFMLCLIFCRPVRLPVGKHPGWADQTPESVPCLKLFVNITCLANMILSIAICCPQSKGTPRQ